MPAGESAELFAAIAALPQDVTILFIEHDMELVFRFAERITVLVGGAVLTEGTPDEIARRSARARGLPGRGAAWLSCWRSRASRPATATAIVLEDVALALDEGDSLALLGRNGMGKTTLLVDADGAHAHARAARCAGAARISPAAAAPARSRAGLGWVPQERYMFPSLTVEEHLTAVARPGPLERCARLRDLPAARERRANFGNQLSGGEQQMLAIGRALMVNPSCCCSTSRWRAWRRSSCRN